MTAPQRLAQYVQPTLHEARLVHQWVKIDEQSGRAHIFALPRLPPVFAASLVLCGALAVGWRSFYEGSFGTLTGTVVESDPAGGQVLTLPDGSRIELGMASRLVVDSYDGSRVQVTLQQGRAEFEVAHQIGRRFAVIAGNFEIGVIGTHFAVAVGASSDVGSVTVQVERGKVSVRTRQAVPEERLLGAGQTWSASEGTGSVLQSVSESVASSQPEPPPSAALSDDNDKSDAASLSVTATAPETSNANLKPNTEAKDLFELAQLARINGNLRESDDSLNKLRKSFRADPRAGLAAFELGRMRMDIFGDVSGSMDALHDAIKLSPRAPFREDAEARLVQLYHRQGDSRCQVARAQYLLRFPNGAARKVVSRLCER